MEFSKKINDEFCEEIGLKKISCYLENEITGEKRYYTSPSGFYKTPANWTEFKRHKLKEPTYPDLINNPENFLKLLNIQWKLFGKLGDQYRKNGEEDFELNYLTTRLKAIKLCRTFGGGDGLDAYRKEILNTHFDL